MSEATVTLSHNFIGINPSKKDTSRFWEKVEVLGEDDCWEWKASKVRGGYGQFWIHGEQVKSHRVAWIITNGQIPLGMLACHKCDNPGCCNPNHLFMGSHKDNAVDKVKKGRAATGDKNGARIKPEKLARGDRNGSRLHPERLVRGESHASAVFDAQTVRLIRFVYGNGGYTHKMLSGIFNVRPSTIHTIVNRKTWKHI